MTRARIFKRLWSPGIDSKEWILPAYVAWRAGTITLFLLSSWAPIDFLKIPAPVSREEENPPNWEMTCRRTREGCERSGVNGDQMKRRIGMGFNMKIKSSEWLIAPPPPAGTPRAVLIGFIHGQRISWTAPLCKCSPRQGRSLKVSHGRFLIKIISI